MKPAFGRGINLGNALDAPREGAWGVVLKEEYFEAIRAAGFDSVRIPVRWSNHAERPAALPRSVRSFFDRVDWAVRQALGRRLAAVLDNHHDDELMANPDRERARFLALWRQIGQHYRNFPAALAFELLNEPRDKLTAEKWNRLLAEAIGVVRETIPPARSSSGRWLERHRRVQSLELPESDRHLVVTVHYYSPFHFTHQGAFGWVRRQSGGWARNGPAARRSVKR